MGQELRHTAGLGPHIADEGQHHEDDEDKCEDAAEDELDDLERDRVPANER